MESPELPERSGGNEDLEWKARPAGARPKINDAQNYYSVRAFLERIRLNSLSLALITPAPE